MSNISQYHGEVSKCGCGIADDPSKMTQKACVFCFGRGFVASCKACDGKGRNEVPVNGNDRGLGLMASTCIPCGGSGLFGVNRPASWQDAVPDQELAATA